MHEAKAAEVLCTSFTYTPNHTSPEVLDTACEELCPSPQVHRGVEQHAVVLRDTAQRPLEPAPPRQAADDRGHACTQLGVAPCMREVATQARECALRGGELRSAQRAARAGGEEAVSGSENVVPPAAAVPTARAGDQVAHGRRRRVGGLQRHAPPMATIIQRPKMRLSMEIYGDLWKSMEVCGHPERP